MVTQEESQNIGIEIILKRIIQGTFPEIKTMWISTLEKPTGYQGKLTKNKQPLRYILVKIQYYKDKEKVHSTRQRDKIDQNHKNISRASNFCKGKYAMKGNMGAEFSRNLRN